jgi:hypothetical protein
MATFKNPGPICASTYPAIDRGTNARIRTAPPGTLDATHKKSYIKRVPGMSAPFGDKAIRDALVKAISLLQQRQQDLDNWDQAIQVSFLTWFGTDTPVARAIVRQYIVKAIVKLKRFKVEDFIMETPLDPRDFAYVIPDKWAGGKYERTVYLGPAFTDADAVTRAGTFIHEVSHFLTVGHTDDIKSTFVGMRRRDRRMYGPARAKRLAMQNPQEALKNADNFEYFVESHDPKSDFDTEGAGDFPLGSIGKIG